MRKGQQSRPGAKGKYRRSTPVIRLRRNVEKIGRHASLCKDRLVVWSAVGNPTVGESLSQVDTVLRSVGDLLDSVGKLEKSGFIPPRRMPVWKPAKGDRVKVAETYRDKYEAAYAQVIRTDPKMLDELKVVEHLDSGEVLVQRGTRTPFLVRKSHLTKIVSGES